MAEAAHAEHRDEIARTRAAPSERVEGGDASADERGSLLPRQSVRDPSQRGRGRDQEIGIATVVGDSGNLRRDAAGDEVPSPAGIAVSAVSAVPADPDAIFDRPARHLAAQRVDRSRNLVPRNARVGDARPLPFDRQVIAVADAARLDAYPDLPGTGLGHFPLDELQLPFRACNLESA